MSNCTPNRNALETDHLGRENTEKKEINAQTMIVSFYLSALLSIPRTRERTAFNLQCNKRFHLVFEGKFFLWWSKSNSQFLSNRFSLCLTLHLLPKLQKGGEKKLWVVADSGEEVTLPRKGKRVPSVVAVDGRCQLLAQQTGHRTGGGSESVIGVCFLFKLNCAFLGQARI